MGRRPETHETDSGTRQLHARLPQQLVIGFNEYCLEKKVKSNDVVTHILEHFLGVRKPPHQARTRAAQVVEEASSVIYAARATADIIAEARDHAEAIVNATARVGKTRK